MKLPPCGHCAVICADCDALEEPLVFSIGVGFSTEIFADGTKISHSWPTPPHLGYKGFPTHPPPHGWRREIGEEIAALMSWATEGR